MWLSTHRFEYLQMLNLWLEGIRDLLVVTGSAFQKPPGNVLKCGEVIYCSLSLRMLPGSLGKASWVWASWNVCEHSVALQQLRQYYRGTNIVYEYWVDFSLCTVYKMGAHVSPRLLAIPHVNLIKDISSHNTLTQHLKLTLQLVLRHTICASLARSTQGQGKVIL